MSMINMSALRVKSIESTTGGRTRLPCATDMRSVVLLDGKPLVLTSTFHGQVSCFPLFLRIGWVLSKSALMTHFPLYCETEMVYLHDVMTIQLLTPTLAP